MRTRLRTLAAAVVIVAAAGLLAGAADAPAATSKPTPYIARGNLFDERYCEILVGRGALPKITVTVYNTIGLNTCPSAQWKAFKAPDLTKQLGATLVVLNGPRHWVVDRAADTHRGKVKAFGPMRLRQVANISITTAADLVRTPYKPRTILRTNRWTYRAGRTIRELVATDGSVYVMQAYSQIVDPAFSLHDLSTLGARLKLPAGWKYRSRKLKKGLVLQAHGTATILQDELQNTYMRR